MDILILGGTVFVGRGAAEEAMARGHRVTLFHRGSKGTGIVPGAEEILGDRDGGLDALEGHRWDAVVDACGYVPRVVGDSAKAFRDAVGRYLFVSTVSVYEDDGTGGLREQAVAEPVGTEEIANETYGSLKVECEREVRSAYGGRATIVRPGLVYGPYDPTGRFPYWVGRFMEGGEVLVPDELDAPLQQIDARDLGRFMARLLEEGLEGTYDAVGETTTFGTMIADCHALNLGANPVYASTEALERAEVRLPLAYGDNALMRIEPTAALQAGLERRPLRETTEATATWLREVGPMAPALSREREAEVLAGLRP